MFKGLIAASLFLEQDVRQRSFFHLYISFQHIASQLWTFLEPSLSRFHVSSTELLLQLHSLTLPSSCSATLTSASPQSPTSVVERQMLLALTRKLPTFSGKNEVCSLCLFGVNILSLVTSLFN